MSTKSQLRESPRGERDRPAESGLSTVLGQALGPARLPTPNAVECIRLIDCVGNDPELAGVLAALMQRACADPELWTSLQQVAAILEVGPARRRASRRPFSVKA